MKDNQYAHGYYNTKNIQKITHVTGQIEGPDQLIWPFNLGYIVT